MGFKFQECISPIQRTHYITSSYTYQFFEKNIFCIVLRVKDSDIYEFRCKG